MGQAIHILKQQLEIEENAKIVPLKHNYRTELVNKLKIEAASGSGEVKIEYVSYYIKKL